MKLSVFALGGSLRDVSRRYSEIRKVLWIISQTLARLQGNNLEIPSALSDDSAEESGFGQCLFFMEPDTFMEIEEQ